MKLTDSFPTPKADPDETTARLVWRSLSEGGEFGDVPPAGVIGAGVAMKLLSYAGGALGATFSNGSPLLFGLGLLAWAAVCGWNLHIRKLNREKTKVR